MTPVRAALTLLHDLHRSVRISYRGQELVTYDSAVGAESALCDGDRPRDDAWVLTFASAITNVSGDRLDIGSPTTNGRENAGYGGLFWRGPRSFTGGTILAPGYGGGEQIRGTRAEWMGYTGQHDHSARDSSLVMVDDTTNPGPPCAVVHAQRVVRGGQPGAVSSARRWASPPVRGWRGWAALAGARRRAIPRRNLAQPPARLRLADP